MSGGDQSCPKRIAKYLIDGELIMATEETTRELEDHPDFENFIRAFWRRIEPYKNDYGKELPEKLPVEFRAHMGTALLAFKAESTATVDHLYALGDDWVKLYARGHFESRTAICRVFIDYYKMTFGKDYTITLKFKF